MRRVGSKRLVTKLIAGWTVLPVRLGVVMCARGCCACGVEWRGWEKRAGLGRRSHLELKRGLHLELKGVGLMSVERRRQGDDEWKCDEQKAQHDLEALGFGVL